MLNSRMFIPTVGSIPATVASIGNYVYYLLDMRKRTLMALTKMKTN